MMMLLNIVVSATTNTTYSLKRFFFSNLSLFLKTNWSLFLMFFFVCIKAWTHQDEVRMIYTSLCGVQWALWWVIDIRHFHVIRSITSWWIYMYWILFFFLEFLAISIEEDVTFNFYCFFFHFYRLPKW